MNVEISDELAERVRKFTMEDTIDRQTIDRLLTLALRAIHFEWRLRLSADLDTDWKERLDVLADLAGIKALPASESR
jgi:hypothetical protein